MIRDVDLNAISDGRRYRSSDMVKIGTNGCTGCSQCCHGMGDSIRLDPMDAYRLQVEAHLPFADLLDDKIELHVVDGLVMPNLKMVGEREACGFLDSAGRCSVHSARPGFCRLFPLGRLYEDGDFTYFLQVQECDHRTTKVRIRKWLDLPDTAGYEEYIRIWHAFTLDAQRIVESISSQQLRSKVCSYLLQTFFVATWDEERSFTDQFAERLYAARKMIGLSGGV